MSLISQKQSGTSWGCFVLLHCHVYCVWSRSLSVWRLTHTVGISPLSILLKEPAIQTYFSLKCKARHNDNNGTNYFFLAASQIWLSLGEYNVSLLFYFFSPPKHWVIYCQGEDWEKWAIFLSNVVMKELHVAIQIITEVLQQWRQILSCCSIPWRMETGWQKFLLISMCTFVQWRIKIGGCWYWREICMGRVIFLVLLSRFTWNFSSLLVLETI